MDRKNRTFMTTSHPNGNIKEILRFFFENVYLESGQPNDYLVLFIGENQNIEKEWLKKIKQDLLNGDLARL